MLLDKNSFKLKLTRIYVKNILGIIIVEKTYKLRLIQEASLNYSFSPNQAEQLCSSIIQEYDSKKQTTLKLKRNKQKLIPFKIQQSNIFQMKQIIRKLQYNNIPLITQVAVLGLSESQLINIHLGLSQEKERQFDYIFQDDESHCIWIKQYMNQQTQNKLSSIKKITKISQYISSQVGIASQRRALNSQLNLQDSDIEQPQRLILEQRQEITKAISLYMLSQFNIIQKKKDN